MRSKKYCINIPPVAWARPGRNGSQYYDKKQREKLAYGLSIARDHGDEKPFEGPLFLDVYFYMPIPKLTKKRNDTNYHWTVPDKDNLLKFLLDSITQTNVVWHDDRQVAKFSVVALSDKKPRVYFTITELQ